MPHLLHQLNVPGHRGPSVHPLPVIELVSEAPGPTVAVTANVHGDETVGTGAVHALIKRLEGGLTRGRMWLYPSLNPPGLIQGTRALPADGKDLNRNFPGDPRGTPTERHAHAIWTDLEERRPDLLLDLHADSPASIPYALLDRAHRLRGRQRSDLEREAARMATATGLTVLWEYPDDPYRRARLDHSLTGAFLNRTRRPALTIECGPRLYLDPLAVERVVGSVCAVLTTLGMYKGQSAEPAPSCLAGGPWRRASGPRTSASGVLRHHLQPGASFSRGDTLATVHALDGHMVDRVVAKEPGAVISQPERTWVTAGVSVGTHAVIDGGSS